MVVQYVVLLTSGHETTSQALGSALATLAKQLEVWHELEHPELVPVAVDECLCLESPFQFNNRVAKDLVQLEWRITLTALTQRCPDFRVIDTSGHWPNNIVLHGPNALGVHFV
jgi:hypothetical protein